MKKIIIISFIGIAMCIMALAFKGSTGTNGLCDSPLVAGHTGAPGEPSCTGCHGGTANAGSGKLWFNFDMVNGKQGYEPGKTYTCKVRIKQRNVEKYGFVALALQNSNNTTIGTFGLINMSTTRLFKDGNRNYISHTPCGADFPVNDTGTWTFTWQAPQTNVGLVKIYVAGLAANHDHALTGDSTYTTSLLLNPLTSSIDDIKGSAYSLLVYPNPAKNFLNVSFNKEAAKLVIMRLLDMKANVLQIYNYPATQTGVIQQTIDLGKTYKKGIYFLIISDGENVITRKIDVL